MSRPGWRVGPNNVPATTPTQQISDLLKPLLGQLAWNVSGGVGSMLTLEFGAPHITVREPIVPRAARSERARRLLRRRHVTASVTGISLFNTATGKSPFPMAPATVKASTGGSRMIACVIWMDNGSSASAAALCPIHGNSNSIWAACWNSGPRPNTSRPTTCGASTPGTARRNNRASSCPCTTMER
jgi:hypothetical protein